MRNRYGRDILVSGVPAFCRGSCGGQPGIVWGLSCDFNKNPAALGVDVELVDGRDLAAWTTALAKPTKIVFLESPSNPVLHLVDIQAVSALAHAAGAQVIVDNVFATPVFQSPLALGADIVTYSTTKHIDGQGRLLGGAVLGTTAFIEETFLPFYRQTGAAMSPFTAWVMLKSLETLALRVEAQTKTAGTIAAAIKAHPAVVSLSYPGEPSHPQYELACRQMSGPSTLMAFEVQGGKDGAFRFLNALSLIDISNNLGIQSHWPVIRPAPPI